MARDAAIAGKGGALITALAVFATTAAAQGSGSVTQFFNQFFLPAGAQITGVSSLLFRVLIPFGIVLILLYVGLSRVLGNREASALAVLLSLFIIPSGGYKIISSLLMSLFGIGNVGVGGAQGLSTLTQGTLGPILISVATYLVFAAIISSKVVGDEEFSWVEHIAAAGAAFMVYLAVGGTAQLGAVFGWAMLIILGYGIFEAASTWMTKGGGVPAMVVAMLGLIVIVGALANIPLLPTQIQNIFTDIRLFLISSIGGLAAFSVISIIAVLLIVGMKSGNLSSLLSTLTSPPYNLTSTHFYILIGVIAFILLLIVIIPFIILL